MLAPMLAPLLSPMLAPLLAPAAPLEPAAAAGVWCGPPTTGWLVVH